MYVRTYVRINYLYVRTYVHTCSHLVCKLAMKDLFLVVLLLISSCILSPCRAEDFYVTPTLPATEPCPPPCYTLDQYAQDSSLFSNQTNITLIFLGGVHNMNYGLTLKGDELILHPHTYNESLSPNGTVIYNVDTNYGIELIGQFIVLEKLTFVRVGQLVMYSGGPSIRSIINIYRSVLYSSSLIVEKLFGVKNFGVNITISNSVLYGDYAEPYGLIIIGTDRDEEFTLTLCNSSITQYQEVGLFASGGFSIAITDTLIFQSPRGMIIHISDKVIIENTTISHSEQVGLLIIGSNVTVVNSTIIHNQIGINSPNSTMTIWSSLISSNDVGIISIDVEIAPGINSAIEMDGCHVTQNNVAGVSLYFQEMAMFHDCTFDHNNGTSILAYQSKFELSRNNVFSNNNAERGCGMALYQSTVKFNQGSNTLFENNTATEYGGGIYVAASPLPQFLVTLENSKEDLSAITLNSRQCFYSTATNTSVRFSNNNARLGGSSIFGLSTSSYTSTCSVVEQNKIKTIFEFDNSESLDFQLTSDPTRVCFCLDDKPQCNNQSFLVLNETRYPGEIFNTSVVLVGFNYGRVVGTVFANVLDSAGTLDKAQRSQLVDNTQCSNLPYTVSSSETNRTATVALMVNEQVIDSAQKEDIEMSIRNAYSKTCVDSAGNNIFPPCTALLTTPVYINIKLESCPLGFEIDATKGVCKCDGNLINYLLNLTCEIYDQKGHIIREGTVWVGVDTRQNNTDVYYWHRYCPRDYCNTSTTSIDLKSPDTQCSMNRVGVLCGSCQANYSLQLGGNKCEQCVDSFLALLIVFMILGILLVAFIKFLDLTVSTGTINGLIFYANVIWMNNPILFPHQNRQTVAYYILTVSIAWINLDFGIESCFSQNLDQLTKSGLQFVFPVYIWSIAAIIILVSHYSTRATKLFGNNSVAVLATLFLLSYGKVFRAITDVFISADVADSNGTFRKVWSLDGNVLYGVTPGHIILIVLAIAFLLLFLIPFTLVLLLVPFLKGKSNLWPLHWINTLTPFFDTFYGPFKLKKQHQVWTGILLISRVVILIVFASTSTFNPLANILLMTLLSVLLLMYSALTGLLYKIWLLSFVESIYIGNLIMLGGSFSINQPQQGEHLSPAIAISVSIALFQFICILLFHTCKRVIPKKMVDYLLKKRKLQVSELVEENIVDGQNDTTVTTQVVELNNAFNITLREPLLN